MRKETRKLVREIVEKFCKDKTIPKQERGHLYNIADMVADAMDEKICDLENDILNNRYTISKLTEANRLMSQSLHGDNDDNFNC